VRLILFTGKGGVGKTTLAAATALLISQRGYKTLVISTDAAHSLSDSFDTPLVNKPTRIATNLFGQEINALEQIEEKWGEIKDYLAALFASQGMNEIEAEELSVFPGMEELFSLMEIRKYDRTSDYEVVIVDCAPTGDTLRLLSAPEITGWYLKHIFPIQRTAAKMVRPVADRVFPFPFPQDQIFETMKNLTSQLAEMKEILEDTEKTSIRLVINPEKMVIKEAQRAFTFFNLFGYSVDLIIVNRLLPAQVEDSYFKRWKSIQESYQQIIKEHFAPVPILSSELLEQEVVGQELLSKIGKKVYKRSDPSQFFSKQKPMSIEKVDGGYDLYLILPFAEKDNLDLYQNGEELFVTVGPFRRNILLPNTLLGLSIKNAKFEKERLRIRFSQ
jgi:arsenite-transporting ATPase